jgi:hypothetical protein
MNVTMDSPPPRLRPLKATGRWFEFLPDMGPTYHTRMVTASRLGVTQNGPGKPHSWTNFDAAQHIRRLASGVCVAQERGLSLVAARR